MDKAVRTKLFIMMILELFIWGAWLPLIWGYMGATVAEGGLGFSASQQAWIGSAFAIASILAIFFSNQFADRNFSAEKFLSFSHLIGGLAMLGLFFVKDFNTFFALMLVTAGLANAYGSIGIRVNAVNPGATLTDRLKEGLATDARMSGISMDEALTRATARTALKRLAEPDEIANAVLFLASAPASYVSGVILSMDGVSTPMVV